MLKPGVRVLGIRPELVLAVQEAREVFQAYGVPRMRITSITEGEHMRASKHYSGCAFDTGSIKAVPSSRKALCVAELKESLGADYDVTHEREGTDHEHVHVEWDPKAPY